MDNTLKIENLTYKKILKNINFSLKKNSFNILIGPNGCGKTTLTKCILGFEKYFGNIIILNQVVDSKNISEIRKNIGFFNDKMAFLKTNVMDNLLYHLMNLKYTKADAKKKAYNILKKFDIDNILYKNVTDLSYIEKKILLFAISIVHDPQLIIIDDTLEDIPFYYRNKMVNYLKSLKSTILFITRNEEDLLLADTILVMNDGIKVYDDLETLSKAEKNVVQANQKLPFIMELSNKLMFYELIDKCYTDMETLVNDLWK